MIYKNVYGTCYLSTGTQTDFYTNLQSGYFSTIKFSIFFFNTTKIFLVVVVCFRDEDYGSIYLAFSCKMKQI